MSEQNQVTSVSDWKSGANTGLKPIELPSGKWAKLRKVSLQTMLQTGQIPNVLMGPVRKALGGRKQDLDPNELSKVMGDPQGLMEMFKLVDDITVKAFVEPKLHPLPYLTNEKTGQVITDEANQPILGDKDPTLLYVDEVDLDDKMFIFHWIVGGSSDLEQFRNEQARGVESLSGRQDVASETQSDGGHFR